ncbi:MAG: CHAT domain-containing protein [Deltaproteobacteria bacterium]|nr:MAG: CHAT domain-containing protein [Deltaproteobacteria bacterium]
MTARTGSAGLSDDRLDALLAKARKAEHEGRIGDAQAVLAIVISELDATGDRPLFPFEWMARLETELGEHARAAGWLDIARDLTLEANRPTATFRVDLALARVAIAAGDLAEAERILAQLPAGVAPPPPVAQSAERVAAWIADLRLDGDRPAVAALRAEAASTIIELWRAAGRHRSALALLLATRTALVALVEEARVAPSDLLEVELRFAAGEIDDAWQRVQAIAGSMRGPDRIRHAIVALRIAVRGGRLAGARQTAARLTSLSTRDPTLIGQGAAARIALLNELNLYEDAHAEAARAIATIAEIAPASPVRALLERVAAATVFRARTAVASWEVAWTQHDIWRMPGELDEELADPALIVDRRSRDAWIPVLDAILVALEAEDLPVARQRRDELVEATRGIESDYVAARVAFAVALVDYYDAGPTARTARRFLAVADQLRASGARLAELQAVRYAAWSAGRLGREDDHRALATRVIELTDLIAGELEPGDRKAFLMNKWSGRDELAMLRIDDALRSAPAAGRLRRRALCALFRDIEQLTCWPIDEVLGAGRARDLPRDATSDQVARWIADRSTAAPTTGFALGSPWSLWRFPLGTVALHYHVLPDRIILFRIAWRRIDTFVIPVSRATLDRQLTRCLADMQNDSDSGGVDEVLAWLARTLGIAGALAAFPRTRRLLVIANDALVNVPFAALPVDGRALCERVVVSQLDRLSRLRRRTSRAIDRFRGFGIADYPRALLPLPRAEHEVAAIAELVGAQHSTLGLGAKATCSAFLDALASATHVHAAVHGRFDRDDPGRSGLELHDGRVSLRDFASVVPRALRVVALPACGSADAAALPGREIICLPTSLLDLGAHSVIASLWEVGDESGADLMVETYRMMRKRGPAAALCAAQASSARRGVPRRDWAGFLCYGSE